MICFKCGRQGHKEDACGRDQEATSKETTHQPQDTAKQNPIKLMLNETMAIG